LVSDITWIVFGDDWGAHPSTTQHLILNMPKEHSAIWLDSIGMRAPGINRVDLARLRKKLSGLFEQRAIGAGRLYPGTIGRVTTIAPRVLPWHHRPLVVKYNRRWLGRTLRELTREHRTTKCVLLTGNPVVSYYVDSIPAEKTIYLRLDDYAVLPGCDPALVAAAEAKMYENADLIVATARALLPQGQFGLKARYLPQGVQTEAFSSVPLRPSGIPVLGFFGSLDSWIDFELIEAVALRAPDWKLEFVGRSNVVLESLRRLPNVKFIERVPFDALASRISHWTAAWIPFRVNQLTVSVNPLKLREYLSAGFPTHCTPIPEADALREHVFVSSDPDAIVGWLRKMLAVDSPASREARRAAVAGDSWAARARTLISFVDGKA
jgi:hypothetical protein